MNLKLGSSAPFLIPSLAGVVLGAFAPTTFLAAVAYISVLLGLLVCLQRVLIKKAEIVIDSDDENRKEKRPKGE